MTEYLKDATDTATAASRYRKAVALLNEAFRLLDANAVEAEEEAAVVGWGELSTRVLHARDDVYSGGFKHLPEAEQAAVKAEWNSWVS